MTSPSIHPRRPRPLAKKRGPDAPVFRARSGRRAAPSTSKPLPPPPPSERRGSVCAWFGPCLGMMYGLITTLFSVSVIIRAPGYGHKTNTACSSDPASIHGLECQSVLSLLFSNGNIPQIRSGQYIFVFLESFFELPFPMPLCDVHFASLEHHRVPITAPT